MSTTTRIIVRSEMSVEFTHPDDASPESLERFAKLAARVNSELAHTSIVLDRACIGKPDVTLHGDAFRYAITPTEA